MTDGADGAIRVHDNADVVRRAVVSDRSVGTCDSRTSSDGVIDCAWHDAADLHPIQRVARVRTATDRRWRVRPGSNRDRIASTSDDARIIDPG